MQIISNLLSDSVVSAFGWTLIHSLWQGTLLMILSFATFYFLRRYTANLRYAAGVALLSLQVIASVATFFYYQVKSVVRCPIRQTANLLHSEKSSGRFQSCPL
jgi:bla regulator protein BlaR1